jgi:ATP-dependent helicase IRC3
VVVANCGVLTEGFDEPLIDCIIMARPTRSRPLYVQCIGRGTRPYPGKRDCLILDLVGATTRHDLVTVASLLGMSLSALMGRTLTEAVAAEAQACLPFIAAGTLVARPVDLFRHRPLHWVQVSASLFVLSISAGWVALEATGARWRRRPASEKQLPVLRSHQIPIRPALTAGEASDLIAVTLAGKLLHGTGQGAWV